jgi:cytosine/creatinine deaminase
MQFRSSFEIIEQQEKNMDIVIRQAKLHNNSVVDIAIDKGIITQISPNITPTAETEINANEQLVLPAFVNGQLHSCKVFWRRGLSKLSSKVQHLPRFEAAHYVKKHYTVEDVFKRVDEVMKLAILNGTCAIRLFADVDEDSGLTALEGLLEIKNKYSFIMTVQVAAFPQDGVFGGQTQRLMREAFALNINGVSADVVAGIPWIEKTEEAKKAHTDMCFALAKEFDKPLHLVCDDTVDENSRTLEYIARQTIEHGFEGRVAATQCASLAFQDDAYAKEVIQLVKDAGITVFSNSHVSLITTEVEREPRPRGVTRIQEFIRAGVAVACAQDDIDNWYYPFGRNDMLEVAQFMAHIGGFPWGQYDSILSMVTDIPATALGLEYGLKIGKPANLVLLEAKDWRESLQFQAVKKAVILNGKLVATTEKKQTLSFE